MHKQTQRLNYNNGICVMYVNREMELARALDTALPDKIWLKVSSCLAFPFLLYFLLSFILPLCINVEFSCFLYLKNVSATIFNWGQ